jgi:hypothetical protein
MSCDPKHQQRLGLLLERLSRARSVTSELMAEVVETCQRFHAHQVATKATLTSFVQFGAFIDAALMLIELELPRWKLRHLVYDGGEWHCSLSKIPELPAELDDVAQAVHELLPLAVLCAFLEAKRSSFAAEPDSVSFPRQILPGLAHVICCDNFA